MPNNSQTKTKPTSASVDTYLASTPRVEGEGESQYFYDFDNNLFELHTGTLAQRLQRYK
jgi:hypothetical protein